MRRFCLLAGLALLILSSPLLSDDVAKRPTIASKGKWTVRQAKDPMTDSVSCVGLSDGRGEVQLSRDHLYISLRGRGGVSGIVVRYDDEPARDLRLPTEIEKEVGIVDIAGADFEKLLGSQRLRVRVLTILNSFVDEDLDLKGIKAIYGVITGAKCGGTPATASEKAPSGA